MVKSLYSPILNHYFIYLPQTILIPTFGEIVVHERHNPCAGQYPMNCQKGTSNKQAPCIKVVPERTEMAQLVSSYQRFQWNPSGFTLKSDVMAWGKTWVQHLDCEPNIFSQKMESFQYCVSETLKRQPAAGARAVVGTFLLMELPKKTKNEK